MDELLSSKASATSHQEKSESICKRVNVFTPFTTIVSNSSIQHSPHFCIFVDMCEHGNVKAARLQKGGIGTQEVSCGGEYNDAS